MNQEIKISITPTLQGIAREAEFAGFSFWYHDRQEAEMLCKVWLLDEQGNQLENVDVRQGRTVRISISNNNRVTPEGVTINPETPEWQNGIPEYDFYFNAFMLSPQGSPVQVILGALQIMATLQDENGLTRFDRE